MTKLMKEVIHVLIVSVLIVAISCMVYKAHEKNDKKYNCVEAKKILYPEKLLTLEETSGIMRECWLNDMTFVMGDKE